MSHALLLVAHGSRRPESNAEVRAVTGRLELHYRSLFSIYETAFLEMASPTIGEGITRCVERGASRITVLPYFLAAGRHVTEDIPAAVQQSRESHPGVEIHLAPHLGQSALMEEALMVLAVEDDPSVDNAAVVKARYTMAALA